jgi:hypothetical protein
MPNSGSSLPLAGALFGVLTPGSYSSTQSPCPGGCCNRSMCSFHIPLYRFPKLYICNSWVLTWFGITPMQLVASIMVALTAVLYCPITPSRKQQELHEWLQGGPSALLFSFI